MWTHMAGLRTEHHVVIHLFRLFQTHMIKSFESASQQGILPGWSWNFSDSSDSMHISTSECLGSLAGNWLGTSTSFKTAKQVGIGIVQGWKINKLKPSTCQILVYPMIQGPVRHVGHYHMIQNPEHAQQSRIAAPACTTVTEIVGHNIHLPIPPPRPLTSNCPKKILKNPNSREFFPTPHAPTRPDWSWSGPPNSPATAPWAPTPTGPTRPRLLGRRRPGTREQGHAAIGGLG